MSFVKIADARKRDQAVKDAIKYRNQIRAFNLSREIGDIEAEKDFRKQYKPLLEATTGTTQAVESLPAKITQPIMRAIESSAQPAAAALMPPPAVPSIGPVPSTSAILGVPPSPGRTEEIGPLATDFLMNYARPEGKNQKEGDKVFGITSKEGKPGLYMGETPIKIMGDDIIAKGTTFKGTPGLWSLVVLNDPEKMQYTEEDLDNYRDLLDVTNAMVQPSNPSKAKSSGSAKYRQIVKPLWEDISEKRGLKRPQPRAQAKRVTKSSAMTAAQALKRKSISRSPATPSQLKRRQEEMLKTPPQFSSDTWRQALQEARAKRAEEQQAETSGSSINISSGSSIPNIEGTALRPNQSVIILPSDCNALVQRLQLCVAGAKAGNTGASNEGAAILDELKRQRIINDKQYKIISTNLKV